VDKDGRYRSSYKPVGAETGDLAVVKLSLELEVISKTGHTIFYDFSSSMRVTLDTPSICLN